MASVNADSPDSPGYSFSFGELGSECARSFLRVLTASSIYVSSLKERTADGQRAARSSVLLPDMFEPRG